MPLVGGAQATRAVGIRVLVGLSFAAATSNSGRPVPAGVDCRRGDDQQRDGMKEAEENRSALTQTSNHVARVLLVCCAGVRNELGMSAYDDSAVATTGKYAISDALACSPLFFAIARSQRYTRRPCIGLCLLVYVYNFTAGVQ